MLPTKIGTVVEYLKERKPKKLVKYICFIYANKRKLFPSQYLHYNISLLFVLNSYNIWTDKLIEHPWCMIQSIHWGSTMDDLINSFGIYDNF